MPAVPSSADLRVWWASSSPCEVIPQVLIRPARYPNLHRLRVQGLIVTSSRAGFSLLEVLIAFAVMAAVLGALVPGQAAMAARTGEAAGRLLAADYALSRAGALT